jgi:hypothetical protein
VRREDSDGDNGTDRRNEGRLERSRSRRRTGRSGSRSGWRRRTGGSGRRWRSGTRRWRRRRWWWRSGRESGTIAGSSDTGGDDIAVGVDIDDRAISSESRVRDVDRASSTRSDEIDGATAGIRGSVASSSDIARDVQGTTGGAGEIKSVEVGVVIGVDGAGIDSDVTTLEISHSLTVDSDGRV